MRNQNTADDLNFLETAFRFAVLFLLLTLGVVCLSMCNRATATGDLSAEVSA